MGHETGDAKPGPSDGYLSMAETPKRCQLCYDDGYQWGRLVGFAAGIWAAIVLSTFASALSIIYRSFRP